MPPWATLRTVGLPAEAPHHVTSLGHLTGDASAVVNSQIISLRSANATTWERFRSWRRLVTSWITPFTVRSE